MKVTEGRCCGLACNHGSLNHNINGWEKDLKDSGYVIDSGGRF